MKRIIKYFFLISLSANLLSVQAQTQKVNELSKKEKKQGWVLLFDGKSSTNWTKANGDQFPPSGWLISNGMLTVEEGKKGGDIVTVEEYSDFDFTVDFLLHPTCNSGIKYFYYNYPKGGKLGMEFQLIDDEKASDTKLANHRCGSLYDIFPPDDSQKKMNTLGEWNTARIVSNGKHVEHWLNGKKVLEFDRDSEAYLAAVAKSKYKTDPVFGTIDKGRILLQEHGHEISFRNIKIRRL